MKSKGFVFILISMFLFMALSCKKKKDPLDPAEQPVYVDPSTNNGQIKFFHEHDSDGRQRFYTIQYRGDKIDSISTRVIEPVISDDTLISRSFKFTWMQNGDSLSVQEFSKDLTPGETTFEFSFNAGLITEYVTTYKNKYKRRVYKYNSRKELTDINLQFERGGNYLHYKVYQNNGNIDSIRFEDGSESFSVRYEFDDKINPMLDFMHLVVLDCGWFIERDQNVVPFNENNIVGMKKYHNGLLIPKRDRNFNYIYNQANLPVQMVTEQGHLTIMKYFKKYKY